MSRWDDGAGDLVRGDEAHSADPSGGARAGAAEEAVGDARTGPHRARGDERGDERRAEADAAETLRSSRADGAHEERAPPSSVITSSTGPAAETATAALTSLQTEQESLTQRICEASHTHATRISQVISCMEGQMRLLDVETKSGFSGLLGLSDALQGRVASLKQTMQTECGAVEQAASARQGRAEASSSGLVTELRQVGERGQATLEESSGQVSSLQAHLSQLGQDTRQWGDTTRATVHSLSEGQLALIRDGQTSAKALQQVA
ncbi:hypothetical protein AAFF_G00189630 [Aldrovandia affinis]|uniref:Uncharacterized protein n=1 Tax=Aldrovandia affinis TaxID=143900 RepID=A0AAD7R0P1_9TELE|nr:hypothetical protein AAFF_G00189630 [Aldrovandia affinis]